MTSNGNKLQKSASGNTALNKESIVELMKTVFAITGICKTAVANIKSYWKQTGNHEARNWKATRRDKRFEKKYSIYWKCSWGESCKSWAERLRATRKI